MEGEGREATRPTWRAYVLSASPGEGGIPCLRDLRGTLQSYVMQQSLDAIVFRSTLTEK